MPENDGQVVDRVTVENYARQVVAGPNEPLVFANDVRLTDGATEHTVQFESTNALTLDDIQESFVNLKKIAFL